MVRVSKSWLWMVSILGMLGVWYCLRPSEADQIRRDIESLAHAAEFDANPPHADWANALKSCVISHVAAPVTIDIESIGESSYNADSILDQLSQYASMRRALHVTLSHVGVTFDTNGKRATANGQVYLEVTNGAQEQRGEPRRFALTLERRARGWVIVHARISQPRIDQPEARP
jgi:hypothetical protein